MKMNEFMGSHTGFPAGPIDQTLRYMITNLIGNSIETWEYFIDHLYAKALTGYCKLYYKDYEIFEEVEEELTTTGAQYVPSIMYWLLEREALIQKNIEYMLAEYDPIENYSQIEHESTTFNGDQRVETTDYDRKQYDDIYHYGEKTDKYLVGQKTTTFNNGTKLVTNTENKSRDIERTVPFDNDDFFDVSEKEHGGYGDLDAIVTTEQTVYQGAAPNTVETNTSVDGEKNVTMQHEDYTRHGAHKDQDQKRSNAYEDTTERDLTRSGNIGVQTAAQMMKLDSDWWKENTWLRYLAKDLSGMIGMEVEAI